MQDIRNLIIEGYPYDAIMQRLHLPPRTFYRYLNALFADDRRLLAGSVSDEELLNQIIVFRDRLLKQRRDVLEEIANNPKADYKSRIAGHHLAAEISAAVFRLYNEGPGYLVSRHQRFPKSSLTAGLESNSGLGLELSSPLPYSLPFNNNDNYNKKSIIREEEEDEGEDGEYDEQDHEDEEVTAATPPNRRKESSSSSSEPFSLFGFGF